jgi:hypothetical protein
MAARLTFRGARVAWNDPIPPVYVYVYDPVPDPGPFTLCCQVWAEY